MSSLQASLMVFTCAVCACSTQAAEPLDPGEEKTKKTEITTSLIGPRDTLIFYHFENARAVLVVQIGNKDVTFPVSAKLHTFDQKSGDIGKWINNQYSDALFADAPEPVAIHKIPSLSCSSDAHEATGQSQEEGGKFTRYSVTFSIKNVPELGGFKLKNLTDNARVFVKSEKS